MNHFMPKNLKFDEKNKLLEKNTTLLIRVRLNYSNIKYKKKYNASKKNVYYYFIFQFSRQCMMGSLL